MKKGWIYQAALLAAAGLVLWFFVSNTQHNLETRKIASGFGFLWREAGFEIGETGAIAFSAADTYLRAHPPAGPCLFEYGDSFPDFLAAFSPCRDLAYLPDVARLEWAMSAALHAPDVDAMDPARLADVAAEDLPRLTCAVDPSVSYLESPWPVEQIWRANQDEDGAPSDPIDLASGGVRLEVRRVDVEREDVARAGGAGDAAVLGGRLDPLAVDLEQDGAALDAAVERGAHPFDARDQHAAHVVRHVQPVGGLRIEI